MYYDYGQGYFERMKRETEKAREEEREENIKAIVCGVLLAVLLYWIVCA